MRRRWLPMLVIGLPSCLAASRAAAAGPSANVHDYVLFAERSLQTRGLVVQRGDVGVNRGPLVAHGRIAAPESRLAADTVRLDDRASCAQLLFSTAVERAAPGCGPGTQFVGPIVTSLREACGFPAEPPPCDGTAQVSVQAGDRLTLAPGIYGDLEVRGAGSHHGTVVLTGGSYVFCSLRTHRGAIVRADAATSLFVVNDIRIGSESSVGPAAGLDPTALDVRSTGARAYFARNADVTATFCAPDTDLQVGDTVMLSGSFAAGQVITGRLKANGLAPAEGSTTTSTTSTTMSSTSSVASTSSTTGTTSTTTTTASTSTVPTTSTSTTSTATTTTTVGTVSTTSGPTSTSTSTTSTTAHAATTTTTSTTSTTTTTSTVPSTTTTMSTTTAPPTSTTTSSTTTTTTTLPRQLNCPAGGQVDVVTTLVPNSQTFSSNDVQGIEVDLAYPATVSMPGTGFLPVNDPADPSTLIVLLSASTDPIGINLYDGSATFFDADTSPSTTLRIILSLNPTANLIFSQPVPFERARFTCTAGTVISVDDFTCTIASEVDLLARQIPPDQRPPCTISLASP